MEAVRKVRKLDTNMEIAETRCTHCGRFWMMDAAISQCPYCWAAKGGPMTQTDAVNQMQIELRKALDNWPPFNSAHEGYAIVAEEFRELEHHVFTNQKKRDLPAMRQEALQLAAMAIRFAMEVCDLETGRK